MGIFFSPESNTQRKIKITKMATETKGARSVKNAITIKGQSNFKTRQGYSMPVG